MKPHLYSEVMTKQLGVAWVLAPPRCPFLGNTELFLLVLEQKLEIAYNHATTKEHPVTRDTIKTLLGLIIIVAIVVATFLYGNAQRQSQQKHDSQLSTQVSPSASSSPAASVSTAPVSSPTANDIQGGTKSSPTPTPATTPSPTPTPTAIPDTGAASLPLFATLGLVLVALGWWRSRMALAIARRR